MMCKVHLKLARKLSAGLVWILIADSVLMRSKMRRVHLALARGLGLARQFHADSRMYHPNWRRHLELIDQVRGMRLPAQVRILDIGCGTGSLLSDLADEGFANLQGCDWKPAVQGPFQYRCVHLTEQGLADYDDQEFDLLICSDVLEHMERPARILRECARLVAPGGRLIVTLPSIRNAYERVLYLFRGRLSRYKPERAAREHSHISILTRDVMKSLARRAGMEILEHRGICPYLFGHFWEALGGLRYTYNELYVFGKSGST